MALGLGRLLSGVLGSALPFIRLGVRLGRGLGAISELITGTFAGLEAAVVRRTVEEVARKRAAEREVLGGPRSTVPPDERIPEALTRQRRNYAWRTRFGFIDPRTGKRNERFLTISTDRQLSGEEALEEARNMLEEDYSIDPSFIIDEEVIGITRAAPGRRL